jgi:hypothetical protein
MVDENALNQQVGRLKSEMSYLVGEIDAITKDAMDQPMKYGLEALEELRHSHMGEILRLRSELDGIESELLTLKAKL